METSSTNPSPRVSVRAVKNSGGSILRSQSLEGLNDDFSSRKPVRTLSSFDAHFGNVTLLKKSDTWIFLWIIYFFWSLQRPTIFRSTILTPKTAMWENKTQGKKCSTKPRNIKRTTNQPTQPGFLQSRFNSLCLSGSRSLWLCRNSEDAPWEHVYDRHSCFDEEQI